MKKFMFSAVALVAFSFAGMANNSVEKTVEVKKEKKKTVVVGNCDTIYSEVFAMYFTGTNFTEAANKASGALSACKRIHGLSAAPSIN